MDYSFTGEDIFDLLCDKLGLWLVPTEKNNYSPKFLNSKILLYAVVLVLVLKIIFVSVSLNFPKNIFFADVSQTELMKMVNDERRAVGLNALNENAKLDQAAMLKARDMIKNGYFAHQSPSGVSPWFWFAKTGYNYKYAGENLAIGFAESSDVYNAWFDSDSHRENFMSANYTEVGTAVLTGNFNGSTAIVVVQLFGKQKQPVVTLTTKPKAPAVVQVKSVKPNMTVDTGNTKTVEVVKEKVLSAEDSILTIKESDETAGKNLWYQLLNTVLYRYDEFLQKGIMGLFVFVSIISIMNIVINYNFQNRKLVLRSLIMVLLLAGGTFVDKTLIINQLFL